MILIFPLETLCSVASCQHQPSINKILIEDTSPAVAYKLRNIHSVSRCGKNSATHEASKRNVYIPYQMIKGISLVVQICFLSFYKLIPQCCEREYLIKDRMDDGSIMVFFRHFIDLCLIYLRHRYDFANHGKILNSVCIFLQFSSHVYTAN